MAPVRLAALFATALLAATSARAAPLEAYGKLPDIEDVAISPDGQKLAVIWTASGGRRIIVKSLADGSMFGLDAGPAKVRSLDWAGLDHLLITTSTTSIIPWVTSPRSEFFGIYDFDLRKHRIRPLLADVKDGLNILVGSPMVREVNGETKLFLEGINFVEHQGRVSLFSINLESDLSTLVQQGFDDTDEWLVGADGQAVAETEYTQKTGAWVLKMREGRGWRVVKSLTAPLETPSLEGLGRDGRSALVAAPDGYNAALREISPETLAWGEPFRDEAYERPIHDPKSHRLIGFTALQGEQQVYEFLDPADAATWAKITRAYKGALVSMVAWSSDRTRIVVRVDPADDGPRYDLVDLKAKRADPVGQLYEALLPKDIAAVRPIRFKARDGLDLSGYLTVPNGRPDKMLPLVVLPHGGPAVRDEPGFDWWAQALASRGYAVLQVNYRGSNGFGGAFLEAGFGQWGRKMQTDLSDGVRYLASQGVIDPARVCIAGGSYGGYAALAGAVFDPGVYRCAASVAGLSDLSVFVGTARERRNYSAMRYWNRFMGAEKATDPVLKDISPAQHADKVQVPILLIHGKDDTVVPIWQSQAMERALRAAGKDVQMVTLPGEDHWLSRGETRQQMLTSLVAFLEKNNPPN
ncbi:alpha/beta hydrolase family protein [Phenylobacterium aquaticum]|uniref:alpha/beta hydrolase family protein n=1 Tax=Phenylobacterium aquaticum TaxID=1763816 RepID=UPI001F5CAB74|nr:S9 family peptidase [Phenylobacterium aquaticum]MCI3131682.1 S9 family peptidase [Phenylobacterium aquaticum]